tara:strand:+ start:450 stop:848 length:399 start_codon:yes stop_codon:yes gene_type:complete
MSWKIIKENKRMFIDTSYYLKAVREVEKGTLVMEIKWVENFMYDLSVYLDKENKGFKSIFKKLTKRYIYGHLVFCSDRIEKYGHQIIRITDENPMSKLERLNELQKDSVINWNLSKKLNIEIRSNLPEKRNN